MGTRCGVGKVLPDGSYEMTYIHYDGYPKGVGVTLKNCVGRLQLNELLKLGHIRSLSTTTEVFNGADIEHIDWDDIRVNQKLHDSATTHSSLSNVADEYAYCDYIYIWCDNRWHVSHMRMDWENKINYLTPFIEVEEALDPNFDWDKLERKQFEEIA